MVRKPLFLGLVLAGLVCASAAAAEPLDSPDAAVRARAATLAGQKGDRAAVPGLVNALADPDRAVRREAAKSLAALRDARAAGPLVHLLRDDDANVRFSAAYALGEIKAAEAVEPLLGLLADPDANVREQAAWALREIGDRSIVPRLADMLTKPGADVPRVAWLFRHFGGARPSDPAAQKAWDAVVPHAAPPPSSLMMGYWKFDDPPGKTAKDATGRGNDGQILGCTPAPGKVGFALRFGPKQYVELGRPANLPIAGTPFTIMAWVKTESPNGVVAARGGAATGFSLFLKDGKPHFGIRRSTEEKPIIAAGPEPIGGDWVHLTGVVDSDQVQVWVNGKLAGKAKSPGPLPGNCGQGMEIGFDAGNSAVDAVDPFVGLIDEVRMFRGAISADEIAKQMQN